MPAYPIPPETPVKARVEFLEKLVAGGSRDPAVRALARSLVAGAEDPLQALLDGLHRTVRYTPDCGDGTCEEFQSAGYTLAIGQGDCEDLSVLYAAMARSLGYAARAVWLDQPKADNNHVAGQVCAPGRVDPAGALYAVRVYAPERGPECDGGWAWVETTLPGARAGEHPYAAHARLRGARRDIAPAAGTAPLRGRVVASRDITGSDDRSYRVIDVALPSGAVQRVWLDVGESVEAMYRRWQEGGATPEEVRQAEAVRRVREAIGHTH